MNRRIRTWRTKLTELIQLTSLELGYQNKELSRYSSRSKGDRKKFQPWYIFQAAMSKDEGCVSLVMRMLKHVDTSRWNYSRRAWKGKGRGNKCLSRFAVNFGCANPCQGIEITETGLFRAVCALITGKCHGPSYIPAICHRQKPREKFWSA